MLWAVLIINLCELLAQCLGIYTDATCVRVSLRLRFEAACLVAGMVGQPAWRAPSPGGASGELIPSVGFQSNPTLTLSFSNKGS